MRSIFYKFVESKFVLNMFLFYKEDLMIADQKGGWDFLMEGPEAKHMINSLRLNVSDKVMVTNGRGYIIEGEIINKTKKDCKILSLKVEKLKQSDFHLHIAIAPTKNISRFEWFIEKAVEFGIDEITPVICRNSVRNKVKADRSERIVVSAMKQSYKAWKTIIRYPFIYLTFRYGLHVEDERKQLFPEQRTGKLAG